MPGNDYADGMVEHDGDVGKLLKTLDDLDIANNTTQFERWFIAGLAHFYINNIASCNPSNSERAGLNMDVGSTGTLQWI